jgi:tRNA-(ms[2]io[6]A)-hydroxylase
MLKLKVETPILWVEKVLENIDLFIIDHASCERKANATALSFVIKYHERKELVLAMIDLAKDELEHFQQVAQIVYDRSLTLGPDEKDGYINALLKLARNGEEERLLDRLLLFAIIEARGCERFLLFAQAIKSKDPVLSAFYFELVKAEARHHASFLHLVKLYFNDAIWKPRLEILLEEESKIMISLPFIGRLH